MTNAARMPGRGRLRHHVEHRLGRHRNHDAVRDLGQVLERRVAALARDLPVIGVDRPGRNRARETRVRFQNPGAGAALGGRPRPARSRAAATMPGPDARRRLLHHRPSGLMALPLRSDRGSTSFDDAKARQRKSLRRMILVDDLDRLTDVVDVLRQASADQGRGDQGSFVELDQRIDVR